MSPQQQTRSLNPLSGAWLRCAAGTVLALGLSAGAFAQQPPAASAPGEPRGAMQMSRPMMAGEPGMGAGPGMSPRALRAAGVSEEQRNKLREIMKSAHDDLQGQHAQQMELRRKMADLLAAPQIDAAGAEALRAQMSAGRDEASKRMLKAQLDSAAVLTPEQRQKLAQAAAQRRDRERDRDHRGEHRRGGQGSRDHGAAPAASAASAKS